MKILFAGAALGSRDLLYVIQKMVKMFLLICGKNM